MTANRFVLQQLTSSVLPVVSVQFASINWNERCDWIYGVIMLLFSVLVPLSASNHTFSPSASVAEARLLISCNMSSIYVPGFISFVACLR